MSTDSQVSFATLLSGARQGDSPAIGALFTLVYGQLKGIARAQLRRGAATLNTTSLVHEAYLKLGGSDGLDARDEGHFLAVAARAMRQILIDHARARNRRKRGSGRAHVSFEEIDRLVGAESSFELATDMLLTLDESLTRLAALSERQRRVAECRIYGGYSVEDTARALGISAATVKRDWSMAQAWLYRDLQANLP